MSINLPIERKAILDAAVDGGFEAALQVVRNSLEARAGEIVDDFMSECRRRHYNYLEAVRFLDGAESATLLILNAAVERESEFGIALLGQVAANQIVRSHLESWEDEWPT